LHFSPIIALSHSTGVNVARFITIADKLVCIDPVEMDHPNDGTTIDRVRMNLMFGCNETNFLIHEPPKDPFLIVYTGSGDRMPHVHADWVVRLKEMDYFDLFDERERNVVSGTRSTSMSKACKMWIIHTLWNICGVGDEHD